jgi:dephospho-CoA kinase
MKVIGLTGGIASGKSTVSTVLKELGAIIIDVDIISRKAVSKGEAAYDKIIQYFGNEILMSNGDINRKKLGNIVFSDKEKLNILNSITHPEIIRLVREEIEGLEHKMCKVAIVDAAILIEMGLYKYVDEVWLVVVNRETQIRRLMERDKFAYEDSINRIKSQFTDEQRLKYADIIIDNNKPLEDVKIFVEEIWNNVIRGD